jgi:hypothetical protein
MPTRLNLGCGDLKYSGYINCDIDRRVKPDKCFDLRKKPFPFKDNSVDEIYTRHTLEHIDSNTLMSITLPEFRRICRKGARVVVIVPYMDAQPVLDHKTRFTEDTFNNWDRFFGMKKTKVKYGIMWFHRPLFIIPFKTWRMLWSHLIAEVRVELEVIK